MKKIGFIGAGNMASAIAGGIISSGIASPSEIIIFDKNIDQYAKFDSECIKATTLADLVTNADYVFFSIKPQNIKEILTEIKPLNIKDKVFVSICAGITISSIESILGKVLIRIYPFAKFGTVE
jgi:pyrroline-5-carboxylate reductase